MLHFGVYFIIVSVIFHRLGTLMIFGITLNQVVIVSLFFLAACSKLFQKKDVYKVHPVDVCLVVWGTYLWISNFLISSNSVWGMRTCVDYLRSLACYFLVVFLIDSRKKIYAAVITYILSSTAMVFTANLFSIITTGLKFRAAAREGLTGLAGHYINYATYTMMSIPLAFSFVKSSRGRFRFVWLLVTIVLSLGTLFSGSRGAPISFVVIFIALIVIILKTGEEKAGLATGLVILMGLGLLSFFFMKGGMDLMATLIPGGHRLDPSYAGRISFQKIGLALFFENPLFGIGVDAFGSHAHGYVPHNQWLQILTELGLLGFVFGLTIVFLVFRSLVRARKGAAHIHDKKMINIIDGVGISIFAILFTGIYQNIGLIQADKMLFMLFGIARSISAVLEAETLTSVSKTFSAEVSGRGT